MTTYASYNPGADRDDEVPIDERDSECPTCGELPDELGDCACGWTEDMSGGRIVEFSRNKYGYKVPGGFERRVTTLCNGIPKDALPPWAARTVAECAILRPEEWENLPNNKEKIDYLKKRPWAQRDAAGDRGTAVHRTLDAIVHNQPLPDDLETEDELACAIAAEDFLKAGGWQPLGTEITVFNHRVGYAGTFDLLADDPYGVRWILDWKTGKGIYPNMAVQQVAYHNAEFAIVRKRDAGKPGEERWTGELIPWGPDKVARLGIVHVRPDGAQLYPIRPEMHERLWKTFRAAAHVKMFLLDTDSAFGRRPREAVYEEPRLQLAEVS